MTNTALPLIGPRTLGSHFSKSFALAAFILMGASCTSRVEEAPPQTPEVGVILAVRSDEPVVISLPGRLEAYRQAEVRARVPGIITQRLYQEGQSVKAGASLFRIDPAPLQAAAQIAEGQVGSAKAQHIVAEDKLSRYKDLRDARAVSELEFAGAVADEGQAKAALQSAEAGLKNARLNLDYANVRSPIEGRARRAMVTEGALVGLDTPTPLTIVEQIDPIYVNFAQPAREVLALKRAVDSGSVQKIPEENIEVQIVLPDGSVYEEAGKLLFSDLAVDPSTDTVSMRAVFPNKSSELLPGAFVNVKLIRAVNKAAVLIPRDSLIRDPNSASVSVVNKEGKVEKIPVRAEEIRGPQWLVTEGLKEGDRVIIDTPAALRPGTLVKPVEKKLTGTDAATEAHASTAPKDKG